uniref:Secreted protein n=1 Tax=Rhipicephalus appendiculatus TaxID=34631 RepID=A0A131YBK9_RHIAP
MRRAPAIALLRMLSSLLSRYFSKKLSTCWFGKSFIHMSLRRTLQRAVRMPASCMLSASSARNSISSVVACMSRAIIISSNSDILERTRPLVQTSCLYAEHTMSL